MDIIKIILFSIFGTVATLIIKQFKPEFAPFVQLSCIIIIFTLAYEGLKNILTAVTDMISGSGVIQDEYIFLLIKVLSLAIISKIGTDVCNDSGCSVLATGVELAGKIAILTLCFPLLISMLNLTTGIIS